MKRASSRANGTRFGRPRKVDDTEHVATAKERDALVSYTKEFGLPNVCRVILNLNEFVFVD